MMVRRLECRLFDTYPGPDGAAAIEYQTGIRAAGAGVKIKSFPRGSLK